MFTTAILILSMGQCGYQPTLWPNYQQPCRTYQQHTGPWWFVSWHLGSPWNAAVAELRARGPSRSSDRRPPGDVQAQLASLEARRADLYDQLRAAEPQSKPALREEWIQAREELERARLLAARLARR